MKYGTTTMKSNVRFFLCGIVVSLYIDSKIILHKPSGAGGGKGGVRGRRPPQSSLLMRPFLLISLLNVVFLEEITTNIYENQQAKSQAN